jgi:hypothetical protein
VAALALAAARPVVVEVGVEAAPVRQVVEVQALVQLPVLVEEAPVLLQLLLRLLLLFRLPLRLRRAAEVADKPVLVEVVRAAVEVGAAEAERLRLAAVFVRVPQFPAWRSSMPCSQLVPIPM